MEKRIAAKKKGLQKMGWAAWIYFFGALLLAPFLPQWMNWENGPIEMLQNVVLLGGCLLSLYFYCTRKSGETEQFWLPVSGYYLLLLGRELSWGRVFLPSRMTARGPVFPSMHSLPFHKEVYTLLAVYMALVLYGLVTRIPWKQILNRLPFPRSAFVLLLTASVLAILGDKGQLTYTAVDVTIEECMELLVYTLHIYFSCWYRSYLEKEKGEAASAKIENFADAGKSIYERFV